MGIYICLSRFCACAAHAQDNNNNNYLYVQWVAMVFLVYFPRRFGMQLPLVAKVLREASALMRISSIYIMNEASQVSPSSSGRNVGCLWSHMTAFPLHNAMLTLPNSWLVASGEPERA